jgi:hypothetical protein
MKAAINTTAISIQIWISSPKKEKCLTRNSTTTAPFLCRIGLSAVKIYYFLISGESRRAGLRRWVRPVYNLLARHGVTAAHQRD